MLFTTQRAKGMFTKADSRVFLFRMTIISTFSAGTSNAMHSEPSWSNVQRTGDGGLCTVEFSRVNLGHGYCLLGRCPVRPTGFAVSTNRSMTRKSMLFAGRSGGVTPLGKRTGSSRSPVDWTSNRRYGRADARKGSQSQPRIKIRSPAPLLQRGNSSNIRLH